MTVKTNLLILPSVENVNEIVKGISTPIDFTNGSFRKVEFRFKDNKVQLLHHNIDLKDFSSVWLSSPWGTRDLAYAVKLYLDHFSIPHTYAEKSTSKITDQVKFALNNISAPDTFFVNTRKITDYVEKLRKLAAIHWLSKIPKDQGVNIRPISKIAKNY